MVELYSPNATWPAVKDALEGASLVVYMGHGNGWPSRYRDSLYPITQDGFGLNPTAGGGDYQHQYFGEASVASEVKLARNAVVLLNHLCYASGNSEPGLPEGTLDVAKQRVDNYAAGFIRAGASAVIAEAWSSPSYFVRAILGSGRSIQTAWLKSPSANGNRIAFPSQRSPGYVAQMDPENASSGFERSIVMKSGLAPKDVLAGAAGSARSHRGAGGPARADADRHGPHPRGARTSKRDHGRVDRQSRRSVHDQGPQGAPQGPAGQRPLGSDRARDRSRRSGHGGRARVHDRVRAATAPSAASPSAAASPSSAPAAKAPRAVGPRRKAFIDAPAQGADLVVPEAAGDVVAPAAVKVGKTSFTVPVTLPSAPGRYRLTVTLHDGDGVVYDDATQAMIPSLNVRVTGDYDAAIDVVPSAQLTAGQEALLGVRVANIGKPAWGHGAVNTPSGQKRAGPGRDRRRALAPAVGRGGPRRDPTTQETDATLPIGLASGPEGRRDPRPDRADDAGRLPARARCRDPGARLARRLRRGPDARPRHGRRTRLTGHGAPAATRRAVRRAAHRASAPRAASSRSMNGCWVGLIRRRASSGSNHSTRSISANRSRRPERGGHSTSNSFDCAVAGSRSPSTAQAWTTLPPFWTIEPSSRSVASGSSAVPVSSSNSRRATAGSGSWAPSGSPFGIVQSPRSRFAKYGPPGWARSTSRPSPASPSGRAVDRAGSRRSFGRSSIEMVAGYAGPDMAGSNAVPGFLPSTHGLRFANRFPPGPTVRLGPIDPRRIGIGDASAGLCGGMAWYVRERFEAGRPIPADAEPPANGSPLFRTLVNRQVRSLDWLWTPLRYWWMGAIGPDRAARRSMDVEWPRIRAAIDAGRLVRVGLVRHHGLSPWGMTQSHQVVAYGYEVEGDAPTLPDLRPELAGARRRDRTVRPSRTGPVDGRGPAEPVQDRLTTDRAGCSTSSRNEPTRPGRTAARPRAGSPERRVDRHAPAGTDGRGPSRRRRRRARRSGPRSGSRRRPARRGSPSRPSARDGGARSARTRRELGKERQMPSPISGWRRISARSQSVNGPGLEQDRVRDAEVADVVDQGAEDRALELVASMPTARASWRASPAMPVPVGSVESRSMSPALARAATFAASSSASARRIRRASRIAARSSGSANGGSTKSSAPASMPAATASNARAFALGGASVRAMTGIRRLAGSARIRRHVSMPSRPSPRCGPGRHPAGARPRPPGRRSRGRPCGRHSRPIRGRGEGRVAPRDILDDEDQSAAVIVSGHARAGCARTRREGNPYQGPGPRPIDRASRRFAAAQNIVEHHGAASVANNRSAAAIAPGRHSPTRPARARSANVNVPR